MGEGEKERGENTDEFNHLNTIKYIPFLHTCYGCYCSSFCQGVFPLSSIWVSPTDRLDTDCYVADLGVSLGEVQVLNTPCRSNVTFICVQGLWFLIIYF